MSIEQHTSLDGALTFGPPLFFMSIGTSDDCPLGIEHLFRIQQRMLHYLSRARDLLDKPRTGWTREKRNIPKELWETVGAHMVKVSLACTKVPDGLVKWHLARGEYPSEDVRRIYHDTNIRIRLARKGFFHDFQEWGTNPDITPGEKTREEQDRIEYDAMLQYAQLFGDDFPLKMYESMREKNLENDIGFNLDKMDATIMALNYQREVADCDVDEFFPYTFSKLSLPMMSEILATLIEYRNDYPNDFFIQYDSLLFHGGNIDEWRREMDMRVEYGSTFELQYKMERFKRRWGENI